MVPVGQIKMTFGVVSGIDKVGSSALNIAISYKHNQSFQNVDQIGNNRELEKSVQKMDAQSGLLGLQVVVENEGTSSGGTRYQKSTDKKFALKEVTADFGKETEKENEDSVFISNQVMRGGEQDRLRFTKSEETNDSQQFARLVGV